MDLLTSIFWFEKASSNLIVFRRIFSFNEYRRLHAIIDGTDDARYSFVVGALLAAARGNATSSGSDNMASGTGATERLAGVNHFIENKMCYIQRLDNVWKKKGFA